MLVVLKGLMNDEMEDITRDGTTAEWHVGEPVPRFGRIVTVQMDGDELELIEYAMKKSAGAF